MRRYWALLRRRDFGLLWTGATVSAMGDGMSFVALIWLVIERGGTPTDVGWLSAIYTAPVVVGGLAAGVILDRYDRRRVVAADNLIRGVAIASVPIAATLDVLTTTQLFVVAGIYGLLFMTSAAGIPSLIAALVHDDSELTTANAMESITFGIAGLIGPALAGAVIAIFGATTVLAVDAATYGFFVVCLLLIRDGGHAPVPAPAETAPAPGGEAANRTTAGSGIGPAVRFVLGAPAIVATTLMYMCLNISGGLMSVVTPLYVRDVLHGDATTFGLLLSFATAGELLGLIGIGAIHWRWPLGRSIAWAAFLGGVVMLGWLFRPALPVLIAILFVSGMAESSLTPWAQTIRMRIIPPHLRGRVFALLRTLMQSTRPIGSVVAGVLIAGGDLTIALAAIGLLIAIPGAIGLFVPALSPAATAEPRRQTPTPTTSVEG